MASRHTPTVPAPPQVATTVFRSAPPNVPSRPGTELTGVTEVTGVTVALTASAA